MYLVDLQDSNFIVRLSPLLRKQIAADLKISETYLRSLISSLHTKNGLTKLSNVDLLVNPSHFYRGGSKDLIDRITHYNKIRATTLEKDTEIEEKPHSRRLEPTFLEFPSS